MEYGTKTRAQLIADLRALQKRVADLEHTGFLVGEATGSQLEDATIHALAFNNISVAIAFFDTDSRCLLINESAAKLLGGQPDEFRGKPLNKILLQHVDLYQDRFENVLREQKGTTFEHPLSTPDGVRWFSTRLQPVIDRTETLSGVQLIATEITDRKRVESALSESEDWHRALTESANDAIITVDSDGKIISWNKSFKNTFGFSKSEMTNAHVINIIPERYREDYRNGLERLRSGDDDKLIGKTVELSALKKHGEEFPVELSLSRFVMNNETFYTGIIRDISSRVTSQQRVERFGRIFEESLNEIYFFDAETMRFIQVNRAAQQNLGYSTEEFGALTPLDIKPEFTAESFSELIAPLRNGQVEKLHFETIHQRKDRSLYDVEVHVQLFEFDRDRVFSAIILDITERKRAEEALRRSKALLSAMGRTAKVGGWEVDAGTLELTWTEEMYRIHEVPSGEKPRLEDAVNFAHPDDRQTLNNAVQRALDHGEQYDLEIRFVTANGNDLFARTICKPVVETGKTIKLVGTFQDITEIKKIEEEKIGLERQIQHAQKLESLGILAGGIAHDFNNLLMSILGNIDLALDDLSPMSPARDNLRGIEKAARRAAELAKQMLAYSGRGRFVVEPIDIGELIEEMVHLLDVSISKKIALKYDFAKDLPAFEGDVTQIRQVVMNLITNASDAIGDRSGVISLSTGVLDCDSAYLSGINEFSRTGVDDSLHEGMYVFLEISDTGCGMNARTVEKIFDPFFTTKFTGRGLGMSAVLGIVRGHGGALKIYTEVGKGTTFKVLFPADAGSESLDVVLEKEHSQNSEWHGSGTVLIADDEETVCTVGKKMLERLGFDVLTAANGQEAVDVYRNHGSGIDCVLLDLTMPRLDGEETFRELRRIDNEVRVILCSGYNEQDAIQHFVGKGLAGFLHKPYSLSDLRKKLMDIL